MIFHRGLNDSFPSSTVLFHPTIQLTKSSVSSYSALIDHYLTKISNYMQQRIRFALRLYILSNNLRENYLSILCLFKQFMMTSSGYNLKSVFLLCYEFGRYFVSFLSIIFLQESLDVDISVQVDLIQKCVK